MIKNNSNEKTTPKQKALELIYEKMLELSEGYWSENESDLTEKEFEKVQEQIGKELSRFETKYRKQLSI